MKFSQTKGTKKGSRLKGDQLGGGWTDLSSKLIGYGGDFAAYFGNFFILPAPNFMHGVTPLHRLYLVAVLSPS